MVNTSLGTYIRKMADLEVNALGIWQGEKEMFSDFVIFAIVRSPLVIKIQWRCLKALLLR